MKLKIATLVMVLLGISACNSSESIPPQVVQCMEIVSDYSLYHECGWNRPKIDIEYRLRFLFRFFVERGMYLLALQYGHELYDLRQTSTPVNTAEQKELEMLLALCEIADGRGYSYLRGYETLERLAREGVPFAEKSLAVVQYHINNGHESCLHEIPHYDQYLENRDEDLMFALQKGAGNGKHKGYNVIRRYLTGLIAHHYSMADEGTPIFYPLSSENDENPACYKSGPLQGKPLSL